MIDEAHAETDRLLEEMEAELDDHYAQLAKTMNAQQAQMLRGYYRELAAKKADYENGDIDRDEYKAWLRKQAAKYETTKAVDKMATEATRADLRAASIINGALAGVYLLNVAGAAKMAQQQYLEKINTSVKITRYDTPENIAKAFQEAAAKQRANRSAERAIVNEAKTYKWYCQQVRSVVTNGMSRGMSEQQMARLIDQVAHKGMASAHRWARTCFTSFENSGRLDYAYKLEAEGYIVHKRWIATHDSRTRNTHKRNDGEICALREEFLNGQQYPGDISCGDPGEYMNCRCRLNIEIDLTPNERPDLED